MAIGSANAYGSFGGANWAEYTVTLNGTTGTTVNVPGSKIFWAGATRYEALGLGTEGLYSPWSGTTVTCYSTHDDTSDVEVLVLFRP